jgi:hypothetical protein
MSEGLDKKVDAAIKSRMGSRRFAELLTVDFILDWADGKPVVTISDGSVTIQCLINNPAREQKKGKK